MRPANKVVTTSAGEPVEIPVMPSQADIDEARNALGMRGKVKRQPEGKPRTAEKWAEEPVSILGKP